MKNTKNNRTSKQQVLGSIRFIGRVGKGIGKHIANCRAIYSFLLGVLVTLFSLYSFIWYGVLQMPLPWKVIDPSDSSFDISEFKFSDYKHGGADFANAVACMFPIGTDKSYIDKILVDIGGADIVEGSGHHVEKLREMGVYRYYYSHELFRARLSEFLLPVPKNNLPIFYLAVDYDENNKAVTIGHEKNKCKNGNKTTQTLDRKGAKS